MYYFLINHLIFDFFLALAMGEKTNETYSLIDSRLHTLRLCHLSSLKFPWSLTFTKIGLSTMNEDDLEDIYHTDCWFFGLTLFFISKA